MIAAVALIVLSVVTFDCRRPASDIGRATCRSADLTTAHVAVGVAYEGLLHSRAGASREHLIADQERWARNNHSLCVESVRRYTTRCVDTQIAVCLTERMSARTGRLLAMPSGAAYPFISEHLMLKFGLAARSAYRLFVSYPRFDLPGIDSGALNQQVEKAARERIEVDPFPRPGDDFPGPWLTEIRHDLRFPAPGLVAVLSSIYLQHDGSRPTTVSAGMLVDLRAGRREGVEIVFRSYEEGSGPNGARLVAIPYARLKDIIRRDGPLAEKAR